ncbi:hypothetical protein CEK71_16350 [Methylovulum psychrotolerans]|uniref:Uncharacterized protein n=1 Tax=Methylovulum psychrotolerans TaxID=1704499 RepID=A0A1Z4C1U1_9GAMM|nr:hypothetical protein CEK71_16350 [Methylovulum psychrotolerans]
MQRLYNGFYFVHVPKRFGLPLLAVYKGGKTNDNLVNFEILEAGASRMGVPKQGAWEPALILTLAFI